MSNRLQELAWEADLPLSRKIVLVSLADQANDAGESWPGLETIRRRCSVAMRTLYEALADLEEQGWISRDPLPGYKTLYRINLEKLLQRDLIPTPAPAAGVRQPQGCDPRRTAGKRKATPAPAAPIKATSKSKATDIPDAGAHDFEGTFEGHHTIINRGRQQGMTTAGEIAVELRRRGYAITSLDPGLLEAIAAGVTLPHIVEFAELYPADHKKCRGSPGYVIGAAYRQATQPPESTPAGGSHADRQPRGSAADRVRRNAEAAEERDRAQAAAAADAAEVVVGAHG